MRWLYVAAAGGMAAHHAFEFLAGVGLVWQPELGIAAAAILWTVVLSGLVVLSAADGAIPDALLAAFAGISIASVLVHFLLWPWDRRFVVPRLTEAEGFRPSLLPAYNVVLYAWLVASVVALAIQTPARAAPWALIGVAALPLLRSSARAHFRWVQRQPDAWWNRRARRGVS